MRSNLKLIKGSVTLETAEGKGTTFVMKVPLTLATDNGLIVEVGGQVFAIPIGSVDCVKQVETTDIVSIEADRAIVWNNRPISLRALAEVIGLEQTHAPSGLFQVAIVSVGWRAVAFMVDRIVGEQEIVVKPLTTPLRSVRNIVGAAPDGGGGIMIVLDPRDLIDSALAAVATTNLSRSPEETPPPHILVVDDSVTTRSIEKSILGHNGYRVSVAVDGREGWDFLQTQTVDLVISDIEMPVMDGLEFTRRIKESERLRHVPVIIVSSLASEADRQRGADVGADAYLVKSQFETASLLDLVSQFT